MYLKGDDEVLVSAFLLTYNHEKYVAQALESMINQTTNFKYEILVGDDCSTDNTQAILKSYQDKYPDKIKLFLREKNLGGTGNLYLLHKECKGRYVAPLEGDDYWLDNNRLQNLVDFLEANPKYVGVSHKRERRDIEGNLLGYDPSEQIVNKVFTVHDFLRGKRFSVAGSVYRNFYLNAGDKFEKVIRASKNVGDFQTNMILLDIGPYYVLDKCYGVYRVRTGPGESNYNSITSQMDKYYDHINLIKAVDDFFSHKYDFKYEIATSHLGALNYWIKNRNLSNFQAVLSNVQFREGIAIIVLLPQIMFKRMFSRIKKS
jgi:glycosyltransferase involved in cell wall biosynthesis